MQNIPCENQSTMTQFLKNTHQHDSQINPASQKINDDLQRIFNPSESTKQLLENQFQSRIDSIEECLTSRSNFLSMFQQMLEEELSKNNQNDHEFTNLHNNQQANQQNNQHNNYQNSDQNNCQNQYTAYNDQSLHGLSNLMSQQDTEEKCIKQNFTHQQLDGRQYQEIERQLRKRQEYSRQCSQLFEHQQHQQQKIPIVTRQEKGIASQIAQIGLEQLLQQRDYLSQHQNISNKSSKILQNDGPCQKRSSICQKSHRIDILSFKISSLSVSLYQLQCQNKKLNYFTTYAFNYLKSFLIDDIFKNGFKNIVDIIENSYELKYQQKIKQIHEQYANKYNMLQHKLKNNTQGCINIQKHDLRGLSILTQDLSQIKLSNQELISFRPYNDLMSQTSTVTTSIFNTSTELKSATNKDKKLIHFQNNQNSIIYQKNSTFLSLKPNSRQKDIHLCNNQQFSHVILNADVQTLKKKTNLGRILRQKSLNEENILHKHQKDKNSYLKISKEAYYRDKSDKNINEKVKKLVFNAQLDTLIPKKIPSLQNYSPNSFTHVLNNKNDNKQYFISVDLPQFSYNGYQLNRKFNGNGILILKKFRFKYEGQFLNDQMHGKGKILLINPLQNDEQSNLLKCDKQKINFKIVQFSGSFANNKAKGYGKICVTSSCTNKTDFKRLEDDIFKNKFQVSRLSQKYQVKKQYLGYWQNNKLQVQV